jgi:DNA polymerase-3 subunit delta
VKLAARDAARAFARLAEDCPGVLIFGADPIRVADRRAEAAAAFAGPDAAAELRLVRLSSGDIRRDPATVMDAVKAQGFFPGPRAVVVEEAGDALVPTLAAVLADWRAGDARLVVTAGTLKPASSLRKLFEGHRTALALALYDDPPGRDEVAAMIAAAGLEPPEPPAGEELMTLARVLEPGDFRQMLEKLSLYKLGDATPPTLEDIAACAPASTEAEMDEALHLAAEGTRSAIGPVIRRLEAQGVTPVALAIAAGRHFRLLHAAVADPGAATRHLAAVRNFRARDRMQRQARAWSLAGLETALGWLIEADLALRSSTPAPGMAVIERALIRIATLAAR